MQNKSFWSRSRPLRSTVQRAEHSCETLEEAVEDAEAYQEELIAKHEEKELTTTP